MSGGAFDRGTVLGDEITQALDRVAHQGAWGQGIAQAQGAYARAEMIHLSIQHAEFTPPPDALVALLKTLNLSPRPPQISELFEIIRDPTVIPSAIFRTASGRGIAPYEVPYIAEREGVADGQAALYDALLTSAGAPCWCRAVPTWVRPGRSPSSLPGYASKRGGPSVSPRVATRTH